MQHVTLKVPPELLQRVDRYAERVRQNTPGARTSRSDALRMLLTSALDGRDE